MESTNACERCVHFRRPKPLSEIVKQQVTESHEDVLKAIDEVSGKDDSHRIEEKGWLAAGAAGEGVWPHRPRTASYCGLYEDHDHYYVCEVKNRAGSCTDFKERMVGPARECSQCAYRIPPNGDVQDQTLLYQIAERMAYSGVQFPAMQAEYTRVEKSIGAMKAYEVREVYRTFGWLTRPPKYFECCAARSTTGRFYVPQALNPAADCERFLPVGPASTFEGRTPPPPKDPTTPCGAPDTSYQQLFGELLKLVRF
jgi:hypothetical protein